MAGPAVKKRNADNTDSNEDASLPEKAMGMFERFFSGGDDIFGMIFNVIIGIAVVSGLYFLARSEAGQELIAGFMGEGGKEKVHDFFAKTDAMIGGVLGKIGIHIPGLEQAANDLAKKMTFTELQDAMQKYAGLTKEQSQILAPNQAEATALVDLVIKSGSSVTDPMNDKTIFALLTQKPGTVRQLIDSVPANGASDNAGVSKILGAVKSIIADKPRFEALAANPEAFGVVVHGIARFGDLPLSEEKLSSFIKAVGFDAAGKPTKQFADFLGRAANNPADTVPALVAYIGASPNDMAPAITALARSVDATKITNTTQRDAWVLLQHNTPQTIALIKSLGEEKANALFGMVTAGDTKVLINFALTSPEFKTFAKTADVEHLPAGPIKAGVMAVRGLNEQASAAGARLNEKVVLTEFASMFTDADGNPSVPQTIHTLLTPGGRKAIRDAGLEDVAVMAQQASPTLTAKNLDAMLGFSQAIGTNVENQKESERTLAIVTGLSGLVIDPASQPLRNVKPEELAAFFHDANNAKAFGTLLASIDMKALPAADRVRLNALKEHWGDTDHGIAEVLGSKEGATLLLAKLNDPDFLKSSTSCTGHAPNSLIDNIGSWMDAVKATDWKFGSNFLTGGKIGENAEDIKAVARAFEVASCTGDVTTPTPAPRPFVTTQTAQAK